MRIELRWLWLIGMLALVALVFAELLLWDPSRRLGDAVEDFFFAPTDASPQLIFGVCAWFLFRRRHRIRDALGGRGAPLPAAALLAPAVAIYLWSQHTGAIDLLVPSLALVLLGGGFAIAGRRLARALLAPALVLLFALPVPSVLLNQIVFTMQMWTADLASGMLRLIGYQVAQSGDMMVVGGRTFEVIETCSGLRSLETLSLAAVVYADLFWRRASHALIVILAAPPLAFLLNAMRVVSITLNPESEVVAVHTTQGIVTLVAGVLLLHGLDLLLARLDPRPPAPPDDAAPDWSALASRGLRARAAGLAALLAAMGAAALAMPGWQRPPRTGDWPVDLPVHWEGWQARGIELDRDYLGTVGFTRHLYRHYTQEGEEDEFVEVFVAWDDRVDRRRSLVSPKLVIPGRGFDVAVAERVPLEPGFAPLRSLATRWGGQAMVSYAWYEGTAGLLEETVRAALALDNSAFRRPPGALMVRIGTPVNGSLAGRVQAEERLRRFLELVRPSLSAADDSGASGSAAGA